VTLRYLLDTNVLSELTRQTPDRGVIRYFHRHDLHVATAAPVWNELLFGCQRLPASKRRDLLLDFVDNVLRPGLPVLPYDQAAAEWHALERVRLEKAGQKAPFVDGQIAAIAHVHNLTLITANVKDYALFEGVAIDDWRA
jgi:tRNA(fMet)-specific endonuclease VapC